MAGALTLRRVALADIIGRLPVAEVRGDVAGVVVTAVTFDHREVVPGSLHCCLPGAREDGRRFAAEARRAGAVAFVCEAPLDSVALAGQPAPVEIVVPPGAARPTMASAACALEGDPATALLMVGVTGTNGKTTVTHLVRSIFERDGRPTTVIGTLGGVRTTPEAPHLQHRLADALAAGRAAVAMEVTSHALVQHRVDGMRFDLATFTNLSQDHLDFHGTMEAYFDAKAALFTPEHSLAGVVNVDDPYGRRLLENPLVPMEGFSIDEARDLEVGATGSRFVLRGEKVDLGLGGSFNVSNAVAAAAIAHSLGVPPASVAAGLSDAPRVPGRFEPVPNDLGISVVVDYAHTPDGLASVLHAARGTLSVSPARGKLIVVFGCGGDRDRAKRPVMGHVATSVADLAILTSDNPRSEDPLDIIEQVRLGSDGPAGLVIEPDRRAAIGVAISTAEPGDMVVIAGKGHETTQETAGQTVHFDDREVARAALDGRRRP